MKKDRNHSSLTKLLMAFLCVATFFALYAFGASAVNVATSAELISAVSAAPTDGTEYTIYLTQDVTLTSTLILPVNSNVTITSDGTKSINGSFSNAKYGMIDVNVGSTLTLNDITINPNGSGNVPLRAIYVSKNGTLNIGSGTTLTGAYYNANGGAIYSSGGDVNLCGGVITGNSTTNNGGAIFATSNSGVLPTVNLFSGEISNNTAGNVNGGLYVNAGELNVYDQVVWGVQHNSSTGANANNLGVSSVTTLNIYFKWDQERQNTQSIANWYGVAPAGLELTAPSTKGARNGEAAILIDGTVTSSSPIAIPEGYNVTLRGDDGGEADIFRYVGSSNRAITVRAGGALTLKNITIDVGDNENNARCLVVSAPDATNQAGHLIINDGTLLTGGRVSGGGIYNQGIVVMNGGTISGNTTDGGGAGINSNGADSSVEILGGTITGNTAGAEGAGVYVFNGGSLTLGGEAVVTGNTTLGQPANICISSTSFATTTIKSDFSGSVGMHTPFYVLGSVGNLFDVANVESGFVYTSDVVFADEPAFSVSVAGGKLRLSASLTDITIKSPNENTILNDIAPRGFFELPAATAPSGYTEDDFVGYVKTMAYDTAQAEAVAVYKEGDLVSAADLESIYAVWIKVNTLPSGQFRLTTSTGSAFYVITEIDTAVLNAVGMKSLTAETDTDIGYARKVVAYTGVSSSATGATFVVTDTLNPSVIRASYGNIWAGNQYIYPNGKPSSATVDAYAVSIGVSNTNYEKAITFRGFIEYKYADGTIGRIYSDFSYGQHTRSLKQVAEEYVRNVLFAPGGEQLTTAQYNKIIETTDYTESTLQWSSRYGAYVDPYNPTAENVQFYLSPLARGGRIDENNQATHVVFFGDGLICGYNMADLIEAFAVQSGHRVDVDAVTSMNLGTSSSYALRSLFEMSGNSYLNANGEVTTDYSQLVFKSTSNPNKMRSVVENTDNPIDIFYIVYNRDLYRGTNANYTNEIVAAKALAYKVKQNHPNAEIVLVVPPAYGNSDLRITYSNWYANSAEHLSATTSNVVTIQNELQDIGISANVFSMGQYWMNFAADEIDLYTTEANAATGTFAGMTLHRHPSICGAYFTAGIFFADITGECIKDINVYGRLTESDCVVIQQQIHDLTGCVLTDHDHTPLDLEIMRGSGDYIMGSEQNGPNREKLNALIATLLAYEARGNWVQYDQKVLNRNVAKGTPDYREFRHESNMANSLPEDSSPQYTMYTDCSDWVSAVFDVAFSNSQFTTRRSCQAIYQNRSTIPYLSDVFTWTDEDKNDGGVNNNTATDRDGIYVAYVNGSATPSVSITTRAQAKTYLVNKVLRPGDVILYIHKGSSSNPNFASGGGHITIYIGDGLFMHCSGDQAGAGGSDYRIESKNDLYELPGGIQIDLIDNLLDEGATRNIFDEAAITVLRPDYDSLVISENAASRIAGLWGIVAYKTTSAPEGVTVSPNGNVTFSFTVKNYTEFYRDISIAETMPAEVSYVSGGATVNGKNIEFNFTLSPYEEKTVSYTVKVSSSASGTVEVDNAYINGVQLGSTPIIVADTLTTAQQSALVSYIRNNNASYTDAYDLAGAAYSNMGINFKATYTSESSLLAAVFDEETSSELMLYTRNDTTSIIPGNLFGGQNLKRTLGSSIARIKDLNFENFVAGDIVVLIDREDSLASNANFSQAKAYVYLGDGIFAGYNDEGEYFEVSGSAAVDFADSILGEGLFCVARPSIGF
ncbi:MAG: hypothetical protein IJF14_03690 [Clostridia bacterium]|nr:hypothetical protein [Clostridia bacterium]